MAILTLYILRKGKHYKCIESDLALSKQLYHLVEARRAFILCLILLDVNQQ